MTQEVLKLALDYLESRGLAWNVQIALREALREHAMREVQRLGQEIEQEPVVGITAIRTWFKDGRVVTQTLCNSWVDTTPPQPEQEPVAWMDADGNVSDNNDHKCFPIPLYTTPPQRKEPPDWFHAVENILNEYGLQAIDFAADFKAAMKDAEHSQRTWVGLAAEDRLTAKYMQDAPDGIEAVIDYIEAKLKEKNSD